MNESYLIFDTETTGLPTDWKSPISDLDNWPRLVQIAWTHCDTAGNILSESDYIVKPQGFIIPDDATKIHGISSVKNPCVQSNIPNGMEHLPNAKSNLS